LNRTQNPQGELVEPRGNGCFAILRQAQDEVRQAQDEVRQAQDEVRQAQGKVRQARGEDGDLFRGKRRLTKGEVQHVITNFHDKLNRHREKPAAAHDNANLHC